MRYIGEDPGQVSFTCAGINHMAFYLRIEKDGVDLYPRLFEAMEKSECYDTNKVRFELMRRLGYFVTESSEHNAEYNPWFIPKADLVERFNIPIGEYLDRVANNLAEYAATKRALEAGEPFEIERSGEYAAVIANARASGELGRIVGNVMNTGPLIPNIADDACVEVPCDVDASGVHPITTGPLPAHCAAYVHPAVDTQALTVQAALHEDRESIYHAVLCDPQVQARLTLDEAWRMTDELIDAEAHWLPAWLGGAA
jgi:alpha-galactosidase